MSKKNVANFFEDDLDINLADAVEDALEKQIDDVPDDEYEPEVPPAKELTFQGRPLIQHEIRVDNLTIVRKRIPLTKSMCRKPRCGYDAAKAYGRTPTGEPVYREWKRVPPEHREHVLKLLERHMIERHNANESHIVFESDLETQWFGTTETGKPIRLKVK